MMNNFLLTVLGATLAVVAEAGGKSSGGGGSSSGDSGSVKVSADDDGGTTEREISPLSFCTHMTAAAVRGGPTRASRSERAGLAVAWGTPRRSGMRGGTFVCARSVNFGFENGAENLRSSREPTPEPSISPFPFPGG